MSDVGLHDELRQLATSGSIDAFIARAKDLHPSDLSDILAHLPEQLQVRLVERLPPDIVGEAIAEMDEDEHPEALLAQLEPSQAADIVDELEDDDAADLISELPAAAAAEILREVDDRADIEQLLTYDEESAGGLMTRSMVAIDHGLTADAAIDEIRRQAQGVEDFYQVFCVDTEGRLVGVLPLRALVIAPPRILVREVMEAPPAIATTDTDQEEVARLMARYNVPSLAVVDNAERLVGRVTFDDVVDVIEAEQTEDLLRFGGAGSEEHLAGRWHEAVVSRLPWLYLNLLTALLAGAVVLVFRDTVERLVVLAAIMPIVAGLGGNAGTQALAVTVRRIALGMLTPGEGLQMVLKEMVVGVVNGLAVGLVVGAGALVFGQGWQLGAVVMLAMWGSLLVAATVGAAVPMLLHRIGADPAVASSVFVTAITDVVGFFLLLGLAATVLLPA